jgi:ribosomal protein S18 acetylase RimI-like enzyme
MISINNYEDKFYDDVILILKEGNLYDDVWETRENLKHKTERDSQSILIAEDAGKIVGCIFIVEDGWIGFIWRVCVKETHRKKGIGSMLLKKAEEIIRSRGIKEVSILVDPKKEALQNWYKKQNYIPASDWTFMYKKLYNAANTDNANDK